MKAMARPCRLSSRTLLHSSSLCLNKQDPSTSPPPEPTANQKHELDFLKAVDILFSEEQPGRRRNKFGWDFHLWQAFVACLPSVAIYLTAQYARSEIRRMEAEREMESAEKREIEEKKIEESARELPGFRTLHKRLDELEEKINTMQSKKLEPTAESPDGKQDNVQKVECIGKEDPAGIDRKTTTSEKAAQNRLVKNEEPREPNGKSVQARDKKSQDGNLQENPKQPDGESFKVLKGLVRDENLQKSSSSEEPATKEKSFKQNEHQSTKK